VANLINLLSPEIVVVGGGLIEALEGEMMPIISRTAKEHALAGTAKGIRIVPSLLGDDAGITGAAVLARRKAG
jgi:glucokinase